MPHTMSSTNPSNLQFEPIILVFEGASKKAMEEIQVELHKIFKGTKYENHYFITNQLVRGVENPYVEKLDEMIKILEQIREQK